MGVMTLSDFEQELIARGFDAYGSDSLDRYINWGAQKVASKSAFVWEETSATFSLNPGDSFYDLSNLPQLKDIDHVLVTTDNFRKKLDPVDRNTFFRSWYPLDLTVAANQGEPSMYAVHNNLLYILSPPNGARDFQIEFHQRQPRLTLPSETTIMPEWLDEAVVMAALIECHRRANEADMMALAKDDLNEFFDRMLVEDDFRTPELQERTRPDDTWQ